MQLNFPDGPVDLLILAGEHSGDEHAAECLLEVLNREPKLKVAALGGKKIKQAGAHLIHDMTTSSVVGVWEVLKNYSFFKNIFDQLLSYVSAHPPKAILFVDYPGFNLRFAKALFEKRLSKKGGGSIPLYYYISPQIWAWKAKRRFTMAKHLDALAVLFPFECESYSDTDLPVAFVGHPFLRKGYCLPMAYDPEGPILCLPGSRKAPVEKIFPKMLDALMEDTQAFEGKRFAVLYPSEHILNTLHKILGRYPQLQPRFDFLKQNPEHPVRACASLMSAGTVSLSCALAGMPGVLVYVASPLTYWLGRVWVKIRHLGMASLLLKREVYPEFIQHVATPKAVNQALKTALLPGARTKATEDALALRKVLGEGDAPYPHPADWLLKLL
jgi:lipid-A-disaccharide synthase